MPKRVGATNEKRNGVGSKKKSKKLTPDKDKTKGKFPMKFMSPYILFSLSIQQEVKKELGGSANTNDIANQIVKMWNNLTAEERCIWETKSFTDKSRYDTEKINYETPKQVAVASRKKEKVTINKVITGPPKPPMDAFMHYCQEIEPIVKEKYPKMSSSDVAIVTGEMWKNISTKDREYFLTLEAKEKGSYEEKLRAWKLLNDDFKQVSTETGGNQGIKIDVSEIKIKSSRKENDEVNGEERSQNSDDSSLDGSTSNDDDLRAKIGKSRSRTPPFVMSNPSITVDKDSILGLSGDMTSSNVYNLSRLVASRPDLNASLNSGTTSAAELSHRLADLAGGGDTNYISSTSAGGISVPNLNYLPLLGVTQGLPNSASVASAGVPGIVLLNPSNIVQPNQMYLQHSGLSSLLPTAATARTGGLSMQQPLLVQLPNVRRQLQSQFPAYFMDGRGQL